MQSKEEQLLAIAKAHVVGLETLETRSSDSLDFHDVSVWGLKAALEAAWAAGAKSSGAPELRDALHKMSPLFSSLLEADRGEGYDEGEEQDFGERCDDALACSDAALLKYEGQS